MAFFFTFILSAQTGNQVEDKLFKVNVFLPGFNYEVAAGERSTLNFELGLIPSTERSVEIFPYLGADYRYYTNFKRRLNKGKNISGNSGDYIAFNNRLLVAAPLLGNLEFDSPLLYVGGIVYGIQRTYKKGFYWGISFGPAFYTGDNDPGISLYNDIKLGWVIGKNKIK